MTRVAYIQCSAGVAGDMLLGALVDAGADPSRVFEAWAELGIDGFAVTFERVQRCGIGATWADVVTGDHDRHDHPYRHDHHRQHGGEHRRLREIEAMLDGATGLDRGVAEPARAVFRLLAHVEGVIHGVATDDVELHEVGSLDAVIDVVGVCAALHDLGVDQVVASPVAIGHGTAPAAHGTLGNPAPAVAALLAMANAPIVGVDTTMELSTPTGVALLTHFATRFGAPPDMTITATGYGAGTADPPGRPNVVQVLIGTATDAVAPSPGRSARLVEANVDDVTGEILAHTIAEMMRAGAFDAWATPIVMKKGRPAHTVSALCDDSTFDAVTRVLIDETGTLGVRASGVERWPQRRDHAVVSVAGHDIRLKVGGGRIKAEHDDAVATAERTGMALRDVLRRAEAAFSGAADPTRQPGEQRPRP